MTDVRATVKGGRSVFVKLVTIMLVMAATQLAMVAAFFGLIVSPTLNQSMLRLVEEYARVVVASSPDLPTARALADRARLGIRYEGPDGRWTTSEDVPRIGLDSSGASRSRTKVIPSSATSELHDAKGGTYLVSWNIGRTVYEAHTVLVALLVALMFAIVVVTHLVIERLLRPLRSLGDGVARLSAGELDVALPVETRDEFGTLTDAFNRMAQRVREIVSARDQLLLDVSHELRSPLTRVKVALEMTPPSENRQRMASDIAEMEAMIAELLELERLRDGRSLRPARQDLLPLLDAEVKSASGRPPGVTLAATQGEAIAAVDADQIRTVFRNLIDNAVKYSLPDSAPVLVDLSIERDVVVVRVKDDGPGVPPADLTHLFEPFFRVDRSRSKKTGGYGLGLSISQRIVEAHGGSLIVRNLAPRGAEFVATLPRNGPEQRPRVSND